MKKIFALILMFQQCRNMRHEGSLLTTFFRKSVQIYLFVLIKIIHFIKANFKMKNSTVLFSCCKLHFVEKLSLFRNTTHQLFLSLKEKLIIASGDCIFLNNSQLNFLST
jgi:hypothetical protein